VSTCPAGAYQREDGVGGGDGLAVLARARGEDGESGARLHLRGRVAQAEHEYETGDHGVA
jgi:hypothetical protein